MDKNMRDVQRYIGAISNEIACLDEICTEESDRAILRMLARDVSLAFEKFIFDCPQPVGVLFTRDLE